MVFILVVSLSQVFLLVFFLTICTALFYFSVSCFVTVMAVLVTTLVLLLLINLDLDLEPGRIGRNSKVRWKILLRVLGEFLR